MAVSPLRLIVACDRCARQFDAAGLAVGSRFRCACGHLLVVPAPSSHEAAVVRCSSCGAPRQGQAAACGFCSADFTLHEQDLDTICSRCLARISGKGRFCHHCGTALLVEQRAGEPTEHRCPACGGKQLLSSRRLGEDRPGGLEISVLECGACGGLWIGAEAFRHLAERARAGEVEGLPAPRPRQSGSLPAHAAPTHAGRLYRPCPRCGALMNRQNYGRSSGVILDVCFQHGVWFDADELERLLTWVRRGGILAEEKRRREEQLEVARRERLKRMDEKGELAPRMLSEPKAGSLDLFSMLGEVALEVVAFLASHR